MIGWVLDHIPWWVPAGGLALALLITFPYWRPFWVALPSPVKTAVIILATAGLAYLAGRNKGAANADARAQAKDQANADKIAAAGSKARADSQRSTAGDRVRDHDPYERKSR